MTALLYFGVAVISIALCTRTWLRDATASARWPYLGLGCSVGLAYLGFSLSLLPRAESARLVYVLAGTAAPAFLLRCVELLVDEQPRSRRTSTVMGITAAAVAMLAIGEAITAVPLVPARFACGAWAFVVGGLALARVWTARTDATTPMERKRLTFLFIAGLSALGTAAIETAARFGAGPPDVAMLDLASRSFALQGPVPPISPLLTAFFLYLLYLTFKAYRLVDLYELLSRLLALFVSAVALVLVDGLTFYWIDTFVDYPLYSTFHLFIGSLFFLALYDPIRRSILWWSNRLLNRRGQQLTEGLRLLNREIREVITTRGLIKCIQTRLHHTGRVPVSSVYLYDERLDGYVCAAARGVQRPPLKLVSRVFAQGFQDGDPWYFRPALERRARTNEDQVRVLELMVAMEADLTVPLIHHGVVFGWLQVTDVEWSDGFSSEELRGFREVADLAAVVLSNIETFRALANERRMAAIGAMATGLAHEIRNPLAGIKGAAQMLQRDVSPEDAEEMLDVVVTETDRLNTVVSRFLDYARPFQPHLEPRSLNDVAEHALAIMRASGLDNIEVIENFDSELPATDLDFARMAQVVLNLLQNAVQSMESERSAGGATLSVTTQTRQVRAGHTSVELIVSDTGVGMTPEEREAAFVPFHTTKEGGTGLGLPISARIVESHGGELDVSSSPGRGSAFTVRLPLQA